MNVRKLNDELKKGKKRKLDTISQPATKKSRKQPPNERTSTMVSPATPNRPLQLSPTLHRTPMTQGLLGLTLADLITGLQNQTTPPQMQQQQPLVIPQQATTPIQQMPQLPIAMPHTLYYSPMDGQIPQPIHPGVIGRQRQPQPNFATPGRLTLQQP